MDKGSYCCLGWERALHAIFILGRRRTASSKYAVALMSGSSVTNRQQIQALPNLGNPRSNNVSSGGGTVCCMYAAELVSCYNVCIKRGMEDTRCSLCRGRS